MNAGFEYRDRIGKESGGETVLGFLARRYRHSSEAEWRARIAAGQVCLSGAGAQDVRAGFGDILTQGAVLVWRRPPWQEPEVPLAFAVLYRDQHLLAVAKPRGLPSVPNGGFLTHTLLHIVRRSFPSASPLHRLGRGTSGLVLFALTDDARRIVSRAWREGQVDKVYLALVRGVPSSEAFTVEAAIGRVPHPRLGDVYAAARGGKAARSHVRVLAPRGDQSIVEVRIPTGRPHQIRIHLAFAGHPLLGDPLYGPGGQPLPAPGLPGDGGYHLHAWKLGLRHPITGEPVEIECGLPFPLRPGGPQALSASSSESSE